MPRVLVDAGVLVAALISRTGAPAVLLRHWLDGAFDLIVSPALLAELESVLAPEKFRRYFTARQGNAFITLLRERGIVVPDPTLVEPRTRDAANDYLLALAESASADLIVSGDQDVTELEDPPVSVLTARQLLDRLER